MSKEGHWCCVRGKVRLAEETRCERKPRDIPRSAWDRYSRRLSHLSTCDPPAWDVPGEGPHRSRPWVVRSRYPTVAGSNRQVESYIVSVAVSNHGHSQRYYESTALHDTCIFHQLACLPFFVLFEPNTMCIFEDRWSIVKMEDHRIRESSEPVARAGLIDYITFLFQRARRRFPVRPWRGSGAVGVRRCKIPSPNSWRPYVHARSEDCSHGYQGTYVRIRKYAHDRLCGVWWNSVSSLFPRSRKT